MHWCKRWIPIDALIENLRSIPYFNSFRLSNRKGQNLERQQDRPATLTILYIDFSIHYEYSLVKLIILLKIHEPTTVYAQDGYQTMGYYAACEARSCLKTVEAYQPIGRIF